jgi:tetratricopeptide (TPR) repeat protein
LNKIIAYILLLFAFSSSVFGVDNDMIVSCDSQSLCEINEIIDTTKNKKKKIRLLESLAVKSMEANQYDLAMDIYVKLLVLKKIPKNKKFQYYVKLGDIYGFKKEYILSMQNYRKAMFLYKKNIDIRLKVGSIFLKSNLYNLAEDTFLDALDINKNSSVAKNGLGDVFYRQEIYTKAMKYYSQINSEDYNEESVVKIVDCYRNLNRIDEAISILKAFTIKNKNPELLFLLGLLYIDKNEYMQARDLFLELIKQDEKNFKLCLYLASLYDLIEDNVNAKKMFNRAYAINSSYAAIDFMQAKIAYKMGNLPEAKKYARDSYSKAKTVFVKDQAQRLLNFLNAVK